MAKGIREVRQGMAVVPVKPGKTYNLRGQVDRPVNHADKMKQAYLKQGSAGVADYLKKYLPTDKTETT